MPRKKASVNKRRSPVLDAVKTCACLLAVIAAYMCSIPDAQKRDISLNEKLAKELVLKELQLENLDLKKRTAGLQSSELVEVYLLLDKGMKKKGEEVYLYQHR